MGVLVWFPLMSLSSYSDFYMLLHSYDNVFFNTNYMYYIPLQYQLLLWLGQCNQTTSLEKLVS
jgi:hypothetical protein